jgi:hypothetical protein
MVKSTATANNLSDGMIRFTVNDLNGNFVRNVEADALILKLCCEECETAHGYKSGDKPTAAFLMDLAKRIRDAGIDKNCSASIAYQLWFMASDAIATLKKNTSETPNLPSGSTSSQEAKAQTGKSRKGKK